MECEERTDDDLLECEIMTIATSTDSTSTDTRNCHLCLVFYTGIGTNRSHVLHRYYLCGAGSSGFVGDKEVPDVVLGGITVFTVSSSNILPQTLCEMFTSSWSYTFS